MISDKEKIIETLAVYAGSVSKDLFGFNIGSATSALAKIGINNILNKKPYKMFVDFMFDENDNLPDPEIFWQSMKEMIDEHPIIIGSLKFNKNDVDEIEKAFKNR